MLDIIKHTARNRADHILQGGRTSSKERIVQPRHDNLYQTEKSLHHPWCQKSKRDQEGNIKCEKDPLSQHFKGVGFQSGINEKHIKHSKFQYILSAIILYIIIPFISFYFLK